MKKVSIIVPCYNEEKNITILYNEILKNISSLKYSFELIFINDGSSDKTLTELNKLLENKIEISIINFSRNFGKEAAILAGLRQCIGDYAILIDADCQQNPKLIINMLKKIEEDSDIDSIAYYQINRKEKFLLKKLKQKFYKIISKLSHMNFIPGASDFRLINRSMINSVLELTEKNRFSKGIFLWIGYNTIYLPYEAEIRKNGNSSYNFKKLFKYAIDGIISFSERPLRIATFCGTIISLLAFIYIIIVFVEKLFFGIEAQGYATIVVLILFLGGIQLLAIGILGEYIAKIYIETKNRPNYIIKNIKKNKK